MRCIINFFKKIIKMIGRRRLEFNLMNLTIKANVAADITIEGVKYSNTKSATRRIRQNKTVQYKVLAKGYSEEEGTVVMDRNKTIEVTLTKTTVTFTINTNVSATITMNGDTSTNVRTKTIVVDPGTEVTWSASASGYGTESGKEVVNKNTTKSVSLSQDTSTYTVYSNCEGASVYFDNSYKGTISSGRFSVSLVSGDSSYSVRLSGGVPSGSTEYGSPYTDYDYSSRTYTESENGGSTTETDTDRTYVGGANPSSFDASGGDGSLTVSRGIRTRTRTTTKTRTRTVTQPTRRSRSAKDYTTTYYNAPSSARVYKNSSVTMNYTSGSTSGTDYGSWSGWSDYGSPSYGSWSAWNTTTGSWSAWSAWDYKLVGCSFGSSAQSWLDGAAEFFRCDANTSTSSRSGSISIDYSDGGNTGSVSVGISQAAGKPADTYVFSCGSGGSLKNGESLTVSVTSTKNGSAHGWKISGSSGDTGSFSAVVVGNSVKVTCNTSSGGKSATYTLKQNDSGKTDSFSVSSTASANDTYVFSCAPDSSSLNYNESVNIVVTSTKNGKDIGWTFNGSSGDTNSFYVSTNGNTITVKRTSNNTQGVPATYELRQKESAKTTSFIVMSRL